MKKQAGFLVIAAVIMIVLFGLLGAGLVHIFITAVSSGNHLQASHRADYLARSGLEDGIMFLGLRDLTQRQACSSLAIAKTLNNGQYFASPVLGTNPQGAFATLQSLTASTITLNNSSSFAPQGRVMIGREAIDYTANDTVNNQLTGIVRGVDNSVVEPHSINDIVSQYQCNVQGSSIAPSLLAESYLTQAVQLSLVISAGQISMSWNSPTEISWALNSSSRTQNSISMLNYADGWAVGNSQANQFSIARWDIGTHSWLQQTISLNLSRDLNSIVAISTSEAWAVGDRTNTNPRYSILRWSGGAYNNWCRLGSSPSCGGKSISSSTPNNRRDLFAIDMVDVNGDGLGDYGFSGGGDNNNGYIMSYNGSSWSDTTISGSNVGRINGIKIMKNGASTPIQSWAVGRGNNNNQGKILAWSGTQWNVVLTTTEIMNAIEMMDTTGNGVANYGWVVGNDGLALYYNGSSFSAYSLGSRDLHDVTIINQNDAWAVDDIGNRWHWDGTSWTAVNTGASSGNQRLNAIASIHPNGQPQSAWREIPAP
jgi:hypothetical protein